MFVACVSNMGVKVFSGALVVKVLSRVVGAVSFIYVDISYRVMMVICSNGVSRHRCVR